MRFASYASRCLTRLHDEACRSAVWVKVNHHPIRVVGGVLFICALIAGIFWINGSDAEPTAFILSTLSSVALALPSVAAYYVPDRKPVHLMTFREILNFICATHFVNDWETYANNEVSETFLKEDPRLRFRARFSQSGIQNERFIAAWANRFPDPNAVGYWYDLLYDGAFIKRFILVAVDGGRALLPCPLSGNEIDELSYAVGKIHDAMGTIDSYIREAGLQLRS